MTGSLTPAERAALKVARAALETQHTAYGIADAIVFALGSAGLLQSPETAAEMQRYEALSPQQCPEGLHADWLVDSENTHQCPWCRIAELEAAAAESRPVDEDPIAYELTPQAVASADKLRALMGGGDR